MPQRKGSRPRGVKKGGAGKFSWGKAGEVLELSPLKRTDPCYIPEEVRVRGEGVAWRTHASPSAPAG